MNLYLKVVGLLAFLMLAFGFAGPYMVSAASDELVVGWGALLVLVVIPVTWVTGKSIFKDVQKFGEKESKENV